MIGDWNRSNTNYDKNNHDNFLNEKRNTLILNMKKWPGKLGIINNVFTMIAILNAYVVLVVVH